MMKSDWFHTESCLLHKRISGTFRINLLLIQEISPYIRDNYSGLPAL